MFDKDVFEKVYKDSYTASAILREIYNQSWIEAKKRYFDFQKTQEKVDGDGFEYVASKSTKTSVKKQTASTSLNPMKTGAIMAGVDSESKKYVSRYALSSNDYKKDVDALRAHCGINSKKLTYCAEENLIVANPTVRFYVCIAFRLDDSGVVVIPPCGYHDPFEKCKQTLRLLAMEYVFKSADL